MDDLKEQVNQLIETYLFDHDANEVQASEVGLDARVGSILVSWSSRFIAVSSDNAQRLEYYGGFEYIDQEHVTRLGDYTFYSDGSDRVDACIDAYADKFVE